MNGTAFYNGNDRPFAGANWVIKGTVDFNNDGYADILWYNTVTFQTMIWLMNGTTILPLQS